jgi:RNA recognition motif-containing protein
VDFKNLYIKNLDIGIKSPDLFNLFKGFGHVVSARVMSNPATGYSKGYGFVSYTSPVSASNALQEMNGRMIGSKPLIVAFHEPKKPKPEKRMQVSPPESWSSTAYGQGAYSPPETSDSGSFPPQSFQNTKPHMDSPSGTSLNTIPDIEEEPENQVSERMRDLDIGQKATEAPPAETNGKSLQPKPSDKPRSLASLASLASGTSIVMSPPQLSGPTPPVNEYKVTLEGRPTLRRRNSLESVSSVVTETSSAMKHQKMAEAVRQCGDYGNKVNDIVDMLLTLKRKDRSLCLFNEDFLREKIDLALEALEAFDEEEEEDEEDEPVGYLPPSRVQRTHTSPPDLGRSRANHRMSLPPNFAYIMPPNNPALAEIALPKRESKAIPIVAPPPEQTRPKSEIAKKQSAPAILTSAAAATSSPPPKEKAMCNDIDKFLDSIKEKPIHEQKQQLGDRLFPLVKVRTELNLHRECHCPILTHPIFLFSLPMIRFN